MKSFSLSFHQSKAYAIFYPKAFKYRHFLTSTEFWQNKLSKFSYIIDLFSDLHVSLS